MPAGQQYATNVPQAFLSVGITNTTNPINVNSSSGWPSTPFTAILGIGTSLQEAIDVTTVIGNSWTVTRGIDGTSAVNHPINETVTHGDIGRDFREARSHIDSAGPLDASSEAVHGLTNTSGNVVVGTKQTQTLTNKTIDTATYTGAQAMGAGLWSGTGGITNNGSTGWFNVKAQGAVGNGVANDTSAINSTIALANAAGGVVYFPKGTYAIGSALTPIQSGVVIKGDGKGSTTIKPTAGFLADVISTPIPAAAGTVGYVQNFVGVEGITIDGSNMTGTTAGQGNGIHFYGVRYSFIKDCNITAVPNWGILLDGDITNFSYSIQVQGNRIINGSAGIMTVFCEECFICFNDILQANLTMSAQQPTFAPQSNTGYLVRLVAGYTELLGNVIGSSGTFTSAAVQVENAGPTRIIGNRFDQPRYQAIRNTAPNVLIHGNQIGNASSVGSVEAIRVGADNVTISGNIFDVTNGAAHWTYAILETGAFNNCTYYGNNVAAGTSGKFSLNAATKSKVFGNAQYNPVGIVGPPAIPATTVAYTNNYGSDATVWVTGGTVTAIAVGGTATGLTSGTFRVPSGQTITLTYTVAPSWIWSLD